MSVTVRIGHFFFDLLPHVFFFCFVLFCSVFAELPVGTSSGMFHSLWSTGDEQIYLGSYHTSSDIFFPLNFLSMCLLVCKSAFWDIFQSIACRMNKFTWALWHLFFGKLQVIWRMLLQNLRGSSLFSFINVN